MANEEAHMTSFSLHDARRSAFRVVDTHPPKSVGNGTLNSIDKKGYRLKKQLTEMHFICDDMDQLLYTTKKYIVTRRL